MTLFAMWVGVSCSNFRLAIAMYVTKPKRIHFTTARPNVTFSADAPKQRGNCGLQRSAVKFRGPELAKMATERLAGVAEGIIADGRLEQSEVELFHKALVRASQTPSPMVTLLEKTEEILADGW